MNQQNLDMLSAENERIRADLEAVQQKWARTQADLEAVQQKYDLVSTLLAAKSSENEAFEQFKKVFNEDFMAFANKESSLADEAAAVQRLQALEKRLEKIVAFPHMFAKRSVAIGGGFSSGKSEFVNSFIVRPDIRLPVGIQPVTAIPSYVMASKDVSIKGYTHTGATVDIAQDLYAQLSHDSMSAFSFNLKDLMPSIAVEVPLQAGFEHICLLDTPGYDAAGGQTREDEATAAEFLKLKDKDAALIWMVDVAKGTVEQEDLNFIEGLGLNGRPFYVVLNKADNRAPSELADVLAEVKETLEDAELKPVGIGAYCSLRNERGREYPWEGLSLPDFFRSQNQPVENLGLELKAELESVFSMYEKAIDKDEQSAKLLTKELNKLDLDLNEQVDEEVAEEFGKKIDNIKRSQNRDFAPIKQELGRVKQAMFAAVEQVLRSLVDEESAAELSKIWRQQARPSERSQPTRPRQPIEEPARRRGTDAKGRYALHEAAAHNNHEKASALLRGGADPNAKDKLGLTPLHHAAKQDACETVKVLLRGGADPNVEDKQGLTPLHHAAKQGARETARKTVEVLLRGGADPNVRDDEGLTPLHYAAKQDARETAKVLLKAGSAVNPKDNMGLTPLHHAAWKDAHQTVEVLLDAGAAPNVKDEGGFTPLDYAAEQDAHQTVKVLLDAGAEQQRRDQAALEKQRREQAALRRDQAALEKQRREQAALAEERKRGKVVSLPGGASMTFVWIEPGVFRMGSPDTEEGRYNGEGPVHKVEISEGFWLGQYAVTQGQWESVLRARPWSGKWEVWEVVENSSHPAVYISWDDVQRFIAKLNASGASLYRLPSEAEWEYACRAGSRTRWSFGNDERQLTHYAWYRDNAWDVGEQYAHEVGLKRPNGWGLYDMHGNVREWVQDRYDGDYYKSSPRVDPPGPSSGLGRVIRGGDVNAPARRVRSAYRGYEGHGYRHARIGVRLLRIG